MRLFNLAVRATATYLLALQHDDSSSSTAKNPSFRSGSDIVDFVRSRFEDLHSTASVVRLKYTDSVSFSFEVPEYVNIEDYNVQALSESVADRRQVIDLIRGLYNNTKPVVVYIPGLDGQGIGAQQQFHDLKHTFEFWRMTVDMSDSTTSFVDLVGSACTFLDELLIPSVDEPRNATIIGESFGGLVAPSIALRRSNLLSGMVLVNPATSFDETQWSTLGPFLTSLRHFGNRGNSGSSSSTLPTPYSVLGGLALSLAIPDFTQVQQIVRIFTNITVSTLDEAKDVLAAMANGFGILEDRLPPLALKHRIAQWLPVGASHVNSRLHQIDVPSLVIVGSDDNLLPSKEEGKKLKKVLSNCTLREISGAGHFVLDDRVNLTNLILNSPLRPFPKEKYDPILDWNVPTKEEIDEANQRQVNLQRTLVSPVFLSTASDGRRRKGLSAVPTTKDGPVLFVANHQFGGQDLGIIISSLLEERNLPVRGLAHPIIFGVATNDGNPFGGGDGTNGSSRSLFETFGAVMVSPKNYYRLMESGQAALLFPGGVREVFHGKDEAYKLLWPSKTDFVRTAAKFNATIVPLSAIGAADSVNILIDAPDMLKLPFGLGERISNSSSAISAARFDTSNDNELFAAPFVLPKPLPERHYFVFGRPISTTNVDYRDRSQCDALYDEVKTEMYRGFDDLLHARESDPFRDSLRRISYEKVTGKIAPTFGLENLKNNGGTK